MSSKTWLVRTGDFFFKFRNLLFPGMLLALFILHIPPYEYGGVEWLEERKDLIALALVLAGLALRAAVIGFRYIKRGGVDKKVYADDLVTDGFFATCRNPLYVGNLIIYSGMLLMHGAPLVMLLGGIFFVFVYIAIVAAEEHYLRGKFGKAYQVYCRDVPRWGMKLSRLREATRGMKFNFKRVLAKDYSTIANTFIGLMLIELLEESGKPHWNSHEGILFMGGIVLMVLMTVFVRRAKKAGLLSA